jgi:hypothetical protein
MVGADAGLYDIFARIALGRPLSFMSGEDA